MDFLFELWLPILVSAVFVFVVSSVVHMVLPLHRADYKKLPDEGGLVDALRKSAAGPGQYCLPHLESFKALEDPTVKERFEKGPVGFVVLRPNGLPNMGAMLGQWFVFCLVVGVFVAYVADLALSPLASSSTTFRLTGVVAFAAYGLGEGTNSIWKGVPWSITGKFFFDGLLYGVATGAAFAWLA